jgi:acetyl esterase/lipase
MRYLSVVHAQSRFARRLALCALFTFFLRTSPAHAADEPAAKPCPVKANRNITYYEVERDPDRARHRLDVYRPRDRTKCTVLFFVHGGAWVTGSKDDVLGIYGYGTIAHDLAERGLVVVLPNYRLSPGVQHPEHIKDIARAFAWTCKNIEDYGGDPEQIFVAGHSAGGHLVALLTTDTTYLKAEGRSDKDIKGVIGLSGVYRVEDLNVELKLSITGPGTTKCSAKCHPLATVFGTDQEAMKQASPIAHVRSGLPPFLLMNAGLDYCPLRTMSRDFAAALKDKECEAETKELAWRTHETLVFDILHQRAEPKMVDAVVEFIERHKVRGEH